MIGAERGTRSRTMAELLPLAAAHNGERPALKYKRGDDWVEESYGELDSAVAELALGLVELGRRPVDEDLFELPEEELARIARVPPSLDEALDALERDHDFLLRGGVFTEALIETWVEHKRKEEADRVRLRPHPWEFALYYAV
jgi:Glutamine synthetase, catalytic domain